MTGALLRPTDLIGVSLADLGTGWALVPPPTKNPGAFQLRESLINKKYARVDSNHHDLAVTRT